MIAIDSRGNGKSSNTAPVLTYEMMSDDVVGVMDTLKIERADIVGWSDGGNLGLDLARRYPDRIRKVVAFGANHTPPPDGADPVQVKEFKDAKPDAAMLWPLRRMYETSSPTPEKWPELFEQERTMVFSQPNWSLEQLATIRARVLLINGEHDLVLLPVRDRDEKRDSRSAARDHPRRDARGASGGPRRRESDHAFVPQGGALSDRRVQNYFRVSPETLDTSRAIAAIEKTRLNHLD